MNSLSKPSLFTYYLAVGLISFIAFANTLSHRYTFDDDGLVIHNSMTEKGISAIPQIFTSGYRATLTEPHHEFYRPIPKLLHAITWQLAPRNPSAAHALNLIMYVLICLVLFQILSKLFKAEVRIALIASILFAVHPLHSEVVANIKSLDELCAALFMLLSLKFALHLTTKSQMVSMLFFSLALLSKESTVVWVILIPLTLYFFTTSTWKQIILYGLGYAILTTGYLLLRQQILEQQNSVIEPTTNALVAISEPMLRVANAIYQTGYQIVHLVIPYPLMSDASLGYFTEIGFADLRFILSIGLLAGIVYVAFKYFLSRNVYAYLSIFFLTSILLTSNIFFLTGTNYAERLYFIPSIAFCILIPLLLQQYKTYKSTKIPIALTIKNNLLIQASLPMILIFFIITVNRNAEWRSSVTLFSADVAKAPETLRIQCYYASAITDMKYLSGLSQSEQQQSISNGLKAYETAITNYPAFHEAWESLASLYVITKQYSNADSSFRMAIQLQPKKASYLNNYGNFLFRSQRYEDAISYFKKAILADSNFAPAWCNIGSEMGRKGAAIGKQADSLMSPWNTAQVELLKMQSDSLIHLAVSYFKKAAELDPEFEDARKYLVMTSNYLKDRNTADKYQPELDHIVKRNKLLANRKLWY